MTDLRRHRGLTQQELAVMAKVSQGLIARIEREQVKDPAASVVRRLANAFGVTVDYLVGAYEDLPDPTLTTAAALERRGGLYA
jgi:transcriptional regulator with XRE-family HTH domain